ncbi:hypothetical protein AAG906_035897 [Vitis piasezkii]
MASEGGSAMPGRDPAWKYCSPIEDDDDKDAEDEDVYMYPTDMHPDEWDAYRSVVSASKASNWEREQHENIVGSKRKPGESSTGIPSTMRKSQIFPTMPFVYELMHVMKENLIRQGARDWMFKIIQDRWEKTLKHPLHAAAYFLNPRFQYRREVGSDPELLQAVHDVFAKLDPTTESLSQFGNELVLFRDAKRGFGDRAAIVARSTMVPENDRVAEKDYLDLLDILAEVGEEEDNQLFHGLGLYTWMTVGNRDPQLPLMLENLELMLNVCCPKKFTLKVLAKIPMIHFSIEFPPKIDSTSAGHSSRPSVVGTSTSGYDGSRGGTDDGGDNGEEILMNVDIVNIQSANLLVKMISHTHRMKTMALEELVQA